ncbi:efflux RND transporter periplasmic adaptor subunit [Noviherbaspirillum soli]|uniref:efflux RND transporter periplasmic adaptor subunit n=1 Tax=Noviherbaspirillum soli TaxID=1064518 RepID=UPI00188B99E0|nr:efflux RND transporter periplasmic adaptor subunit [Noviherbaspirillum soli]
MNAKKILLVVLVTGVLGAGGYGLYAFGMQQGMKMTTSDVPTKAGQQAANGASEAGKVDPASGRKVLYWHDPMVPGQKFDKPGKSPFMDMQLVPVYADEAGDDGKITISPRVQQNLGVRTAEVTKGNVAAVVEAVGSVAYNERDVAVIQARSNGFVERLYVRAPLDPVRKGQPLVQIYVPDWIAAQEDYLTVKQMQGPETKDLLDAARQRMRLAGMSDEQIRLVETTAKLQPRMTIIAPISGVIAELSVREGMTVMSGASLFRINGLSTIWVNADVPENLSAQVRPGASVEARTPSLPGTTIKGKVSAILPEVNAATRTIKARVELANPEGRLVPGMFATINFTPATKQDVLTIPTEAVIQTGRRSVVMVAQDNGGFTPVDVEIGAEANGQTEIRKGLEAGQKVVISGQFLIDSEASLKGTETRMGEAPQAGTSSTSDQTHAGKGKIESISNDEITISHGPIPSLQWGEMTMGFKAPASGVPKNIAVGDTVTFEIRPTKDGAYEIAAISPAGTAPNAAKGSSAGTTSQRQEAVPANAEGVKK